LTQGNFWKERAFLIMDLIWELTHHIFLEKGLNWCRGHGNQGQIIFNVLENKIDMEFLEYSTKKEEIKL